MNKVKFGPAGNSASFSKNHKSSVEAPKWLHDMGLNAYEYQCGRGITIGEEKATIIGQRAKLYDISMSLHAPYFINLSSADEERHEKNIGYIINSSIIAKAMGAERIVVHCGGLGKLTREEALQNTLNAMPKILDRMDEEGVGDVRLCIETMGKINVIGTLEEVCKIVALDDRLLPCIDFGHLNSRTFGSYNSYEDFLSIFDTMENMIGKERTHIFHSHFSKIEYGKGGEVRHLTLEDTEYGPDFDFIAEIIHERGYEPTIICESNGVQAEDAQKLMNMYKREAQFEK